MTQEFRTNHENLNAARELAGYSQRSGIVVREDLSLFTWCDDDGIEVILNPESAIDLGLSLFAAVRDALARAAKELKEEKCPPN